MSSQRQHGKGQGDCEPLVSYRPQARRAPPVLRRDRDSVAYNGNCRTLTKVFRLALQSCPGLTCTSSSMTSSSPATGGFQERVPENLAIDHVWSLSASKTLDMHFSVNRHEQPNRDKGSGFAPTRLGFSKSFVSQLPKPSFSVHHRIRRGHDGQPSALRRGPSRHLSGQVHTLLKSNSLLRGSGSRPPPEGSSISPHSGKCDCRARVIRGGYQFCSHGCSVFFARRDRGVGMRDLAGPPIRLVSQRLSGLGFAAACDR